MTLDEAIEILGDIIRFVKPADPPYEHDAIKLGIEALKEVKDKRYLGTGYKYILLPGETEE